MVRDVQAASGRRPSGIALRFADYEDAPALKKVFARIDNMILIPSDREVSVVMRHHTNAIEAALAAGTFLSRAPLNRRDTRPAK